MKNGETELISFKSLDIGESQVGDMVLISTRSGVATNIEIINKADKIQKEAVLEEAKKLDIKIEQELNTNQTNTTAFSSPSIKDEVKQDEEIAKKTDDTANIDTIFEKGIIDTKVTEEELKGKDLQKRTIDRKNKEINPPSSTKLDTAR